MVLIGQEYLNIRLQMVRIAGGCVDIRIGDCSYTSRISKYYIVDGLDRWRMC